MGENSSLTGSFETRPVWKKFSKIVNKWFNPALEESSKTQVCYSIMHKATSELLNNDSSELMLRKIVHHLVPEMGDWCLVNLAKPEGGLYRFSEARVMSQEKSQALDEIRKRFPPNPWAAHGLGRVIRDGISELMPQVNDELFSGNSDDPIYLKLWRSLGIVSYIGVPIHVRGKIYGGISIDSMSPSRIYNQSDLAFMEEIAKLMGLALERTELLKQAQVLNQQKDDFLAMLSHELRTPISAVVGWSDLLLANPRNPNLDLNKGLEIIRKNALHQKDLINDMFDISLVTKGLMKIDRRKLDLAELIQSCVDAVMPQAMEREIALDFHNSVSDATTYGDHSRLEQVFLNVLNNSLKFTPHGGSVAIIMLPAPGGLSIQIKDNGIGIEPSFLPFVFDRFRQVDNSTSRSYGGIGIGLTIAHHIVQLHGGEIKVASEGKKRGACVSITLPKTIMTILPKLM